MQEVHFGRGCTLPHDVVLIVWRVLCANCATVYLEKHRCRKRFMFFLFTVCFLVHGQVTIIFVVSVCLSVCLFVCLFDCAEFFSAVFDPISIKLGHTLYVWV